MAEPLEMILVKSGLKNDRVAFWEGHKQHPENEEAYVAGSKPVKVAKTDGVMKAIRAGDLIQVTEEDTGEAVEEPQVEDNAKTEVAEAEDAKSPEQTEETEPQETEEDDDENAESEDTAKDDDEDAKNAPGTLFSSTSVVTEPARRGGRPPRKQA